VVTRPEVGVTVMLAARVEFHFARAARFSEASRVWVDAPAEAASRTQSPPRPVRLFDA
jgi:hypothetical protein